MWACTACVLGASPYVCPFKAAPQNSCIIVSSVPVLPGPAQDGSLAPEYTERVWSYMWALFYVYGREFTGLVEHVQLLMHSHGSIFVTFTT
jgi:hypothetical protein